MKDFDSGLASNLNLECYSELKEAFKDWSDKIKLLVKPITLKIERRRKE